MLVAHPRFNGQTYRYPALVCHRSRPDSLHNLPHSDTHIHEGHHAHYPDSQHFAERVRTNALKAKPNPDANLTIPKCNLCILLDHQVLLCVVLHPSPSPHSRCEDPQRQLSSLLSSRFSPSLRTGATGHAFPWLHCCCKSSWTSQSTILVCTLWRSPPSSSKLASVCELRTPLQCVRAWLTSMRTPGGLLSRSSLRE